MKPPPFLYGTAWKEEATEGLVTAALRAGFRGIDTANQRKHYFEEGVGRGIAAAGVPRDQLWIQTKFTFRGGQDHRLPYDERAPIEEQVAQSFARSLEHLGTDRIDSLVLHGPSRHDGLGPDDHAAWRAMEALTADGKVGALGVSNVTARQVDAIVRFAAVKPRFVQNRCYADRGWDLEVRTACADHGLVYQGFSLLTANRHLLAVPPISDLAERHGKTPAQIVFRFAQQLGMLPLTGTRDPAHMAQDLAVADFTLGDDEVALIARS